MLESPILKTPIHKMAQSDTTPQTTQDELIAKLTELESQQALDMGEKSVEPVEDTIEKVDRAAENDDVNEEADSEPAGTPSEAEKTEKESPEKDEKVESQAPKKEKAPKEEKIPLNEEEKKKYSAYLKQNLTKYSADLGKKLVRWDAIKQAEQALNAKQAELQKAYDAQASKLKTEAEQFRAEQEASRPTAEKYIEFSNNLQAQVASKEEEANRAEENGDFDRAEILKQEAIVLKADVKRANEAAEHLKKNPPLSLQKQQERFVEHQKSWIDKAAIDFPEFAKKDSAVQKEAAEYYRQITDSEPTAAKLPGFIYFCAERATMKAAADRVPAMDKELNQLRSKVKDLESLTNPTPSGGSSRALRGNKSTSEMSQEELYQSLREDASLIRR